MTFLTDIAKPGRNTAVTIAITLTVPTAKTLYLTNREGTYGGTYYEQRVIGDPSIAAEKADPITGETGLLTGSFTVQNRKLNYQAAGKTFGDILNTYVFAGVPVVMTQWNVDTGTSGATFTGYINEIDEYTPEEITFNVGENYKSNMTIPSMVIERAAFARAPEENFGLRIPVVYGDFATVTGYIAHGERQIVLPAVCVDKTGPTNGLPIYRICNNDGVAAAHTTYTTSLVLWESSLNEMAYLDSTCYTMTNDTAKVEAEFSDNAFAYVYIIPTGVGAGNTATDPTKAMDRNRSSYVSINDGDILSLKLPTVSSCGRIAGIVLYTDFAGTPGAHGTIVYGIWSPVGSVYDQFWTAAAGEVDVAYGDDYTAESAASWRNDWHFNFADGSDNQQAAEVRVEMQSDTGHCRVRGVAIRVYYEVGRDIRAKEIIKPKVYRHMW